MRSTEISLQQRLEYVSRAILSAKSSSTLSTQGADGEFLHQLEEKMEVVRIQAQIQQTLVRQYSQHPAAKNAIAELDHEIIHISKLFAVYAENFKLSECKLSIDRMTSLSLKVVSLGKLYAGTPRYFPLEFLVMHLEQEACRLLWDAGFVITTMLEIGVQLQRLLDVYDQLFKTRDPCWQRLRKPLHLVECIHVLLSGYVDDPSRVPAFDRRRFTNVCLDNICGYLVELQSLSPNAALQHIIGNFKTLQSKLQKVH
ncbi:hypothetical protein CRUP_020632 [Coryphaenoides rupestris]|nr:hypothetical protein CRUP_020632 [Coryphaenoides rupestris]